MLIHDSINRKPIRIMRESREEMELVKIKYKNRNFQYLGEVKDNFWHPCLLSDRPDLLLLKSARKEMPGCPQNRQSLLHYLPSP